MAKKIKGITIEIDGNTTGLSSALKDVNQQTRDISKELREVDNLLKFNPGNTELVAQKQELLADAVENTSKKLEALKDAQKQAQDQLARGEIGEDEYKALQREIIKTESQLNNLEKKAKDFGGVMTQQLKKAGEDMKAFGGKVEDAGKKFAPISAVAAGAIAGSVMTFTSFDDAMKQVQATMGGTSDDYDKLSKAAQDMGANTRYSATEAADALNYLALAGYDTDRAIGTLPKVLNLAQAGGMDLASASDMVTDSMAALNMEASDLDMFVDQLAATSQKSNTSVKQLGEGILTVGGTAKTLAGGTTELNTVLGLLADNGIKGAEGGTKLRNMILSLTAPTDVARKSIEQLGIDVFDATGEMRPLQDIMGDLDTQLSHLSDGQKTEVLSTIFNKADLASVNALMSTNADRWEELNGKIADSEGVAQQMADTMESGIGGAFRSLKSALEGVMIGIGEALAPVIQDLSGKIKGLADWFNGLDDSQKKTIATILVLVAGLAPLLIIVGKVITVVGTITSALPVLGAAFTALSGPIGIAIAAVAAVIAIGVALYKNWDLVKEKANQFWNYLKDKFNAIKEAITAPVNNAIDTLKNINLLEIGKNIMDGLIDGIKSKIASIKDTISSVASTVTGGVKRALRISSPSKVMEEMGEYTGEGFAIGIKNSIKEVGKQTLALAEVPQGLGGTGQTIGNNVYNYSGGDIVIQTMAVREEADIKKIASELFYLQESKKRGRGSR